MTFMNNLQSSVIQTRSQTVSYFPKGYCLNYLLVFFQITFYFLEIQEIFHVTLLSCNLPSLF